MFSDAGRARLFRCRTGISGNVLIFIKNVIDKSGARQPPYIIQIGRITNFLRAPNDSSPHRVDGTFRGVSYCQKNFRKFSHLLQIVAAFLSGFLLEIPGWVHPAREPFRISAKAPGREATEMQQQQASHAVSSLYCDLFQNNSLNKPSVPPPASVLGQVNQVAGAEMSMQYVSRSAPQAGKAPRALKSPNEANSQPELPLIPPSPPVTTDKVRPLTGASWKVEYTCLVEEIQIRHYSPKTLKTYRLWLRHFQTFTRSKPPESLTAADVKEFLTCWLSSGRLRPRPRIRHSMPCCFLTARFAKGIW